MDSIIELLTSKTKDVLTALSEGCKTNSEIAEATGLSTSTVSRTIRKLEALGFAEGGKELKLTSKGRVLLACYNSLSNFERLFELLDLNDYRLDDIPDYLLYRMYELGNVIVIEDNRTILQPHDEVVRSIMESERVYGYGRVAYAGYADIFVNAAERGIYVEAIASESVFEAVRDKYSEEIKRFLELENTELMVAPDFSFSAILTDCTFFMSFFFIDGTLDYKRFYAWYDSCGLRWGRALFRYIEEFARPVKFEDLEKMKLKLQSL